MIEEAIREQVRLSLRDELPGALAEALKGGAKQAQPKLATRNECARALGITPRSLDTLRAQGLPVVMVLSSPRFDIPAVIAWLKERK